MNEDLWAGVDLKVKYATFHLEEMQRSIVPKMLTRMQVVHTSAGAIISNDWQRSFYPHFDAFLS